MPSLTRRHWLACTAGAHLAAQTPRQPDVLLINTDDQRWDTIRALGNPQIRTPNLDRLAARSAVFENHYCQGSMMPAVCLPSRTQLMTGRSVFRAPEPKDHSGQYPLLAKVFEKAGYSTFHVGKRSNTFLPASQAFQTTIFAEQLTKDRAEQSRLHADAVIRFLKERKPDERLLIYMAPPVPHDPRVAPKRFMEMYDPARIRLPKNFLPQHPFDNGELKVRDELLASFPRTPDEMRRHLADYYAAISCLDHEVGRILMALRETGRASNTLVVFTSDQGLAVGGCHGLMGKQNLYEHVKPPLLLAGPGIRPGRHRALTYVMDVFPTLCDLAGLPVPEGVEGRSLAPILRGQASSVRRSLFAVYRDCQRMTRDERWKLIWYPKIDRYQLFDLQRDPWELEDFASRPSHRPQLERLKRQLAELQNEFDDRAAPRPV
ncbi:MAG: sulfatase-like hydrolase/transferase [Bryobacteraceae bacterium]|nr:sulfatase-like hydrolase/transferase [Bryobacteraceae bacterium]MDW8378017.1 sulfatase-like hydrolase/transferase [Bryobacterales bacterium]